MSGKSMNAKLLKKTDSQKIDPRAEINNNITVGDLSNVIGIAIGHSAQANVTQTTGTTPDEISTAFALILQKVNEMHDGPGKTIAETAVQGLKTEAKRGEQTDEKHVNEWFTSLAQIAPDVWDVAVDTFTNPIKGVSTIFQKIAKRAKAEKKDKGA